MATTNINVREIDLDRIDPDPSQPRQHFDPVKLKELAGSIEMLDVQQPIVLRYNKATRRYRIVMGERRWRASKLAGKTTIPARIEQGTDERFLEQLAENTGRVDMTPMEEGAGFAKAIDEGHTLEEVAQACGKSVAFVQWRMDLLGLVGSCREALDKGHIPVGVAWYLAKVTPQAQEGFLTRWVRGEFPTHRDAEHALKARKEQEEQGELFAVPEMSEEEKARLRADRKKTMTSFDRLATAGEILADLAAMDPAELARQLDGVRGGPAAYQQRVGELKGLAGRAEVTLRRAAALLAAGELGEPKNNGQIITEET
ncbi:ParB/RepB/Spo0J family partition protein [Nocardiopsis terrae]|uniref:ParB/RepB/Spo0J family partition protein n=1 Tax=Streptomyces sp. NPDC057554 TaxID=3350538 RepID=UPI00367E5687